MSEAAEQSKPTKPEPKDEQSLRQATWEHRRHGERIKEKAEVSKIEPNTPEPCIDPDPPTECPKCGADLVLADCYSGGLDFQDSGIYQEVHCPNDECGHCWYDIYRFAATMDYETGRDINAYICTVSEASDSKA